MKYDLTKKKTKFAERTLVDFSDTLFLVLRKKPLEQITIRELCDAANYPRATFYNYFDDIYDLLHYCWVRFAGEIALDDYAKLKPEERTYILFERCYDALSEKDEMMQSILLHNPTDGRFFESLRQFIREKICAIIVNSPCSAKYEIPREIVAEHYANTIQTVLEWCFIREKRMTKDEAIQTLHYLLGAL